MTVQSATGKSQVETQERTLIMTRTFAAPRALVFETYTSCEHLKHWWGPKGWTLPVCKMDFRPGGTWLYCMEGPNGEQSWGKTVYKEIDAPEQLIYTDLFVDSEGNQLDGTPELAITITFSEQDGQTVVHTRTELPSEEMLQSMLDMGVVEGMSQTWDRLDEHLAAQQS